MTSYNLQLPPAFITPDARAHKLAGREGALSGELDVAVLRRLARGEHDGPRRVLKQWGFAPGKYLNERVPGRPTQWTRTVLCALAAEAIRDSYHARVWEWVKAVVETILSAWSREG